MAVAAKLVKELRQLSGLPMMVCKKALQEADGNLEKATDILRKQGQKVMAEKADRKVKEIRVEGFVDPDGQHGVLLSLCCETEPVTKCEDFVTFHNNIISGLMGCDKVPETKDELMELELENGKTVKQNLEDLVGKIRENIQIGDFSTMKGDAVFQYIHFDKRHGAMVVLSGADPADEKIKEIGKNLCMHVVFAKPKYMTKDDVPKNDVEKEREVLLAAVHNNPKHSKKPEEIKNRIVEGQINRFFSENCFLEQPFIRDDKIKVEKYITKECKDSKLSNFVYIGLAK